MVADAIVGTDNPLTSRVMVNRIWYWIFGTGLVRTPDDFGHLGDRPSHPELLDYLAVRFMEEGWSLKRLIRRIVGSSTWRQSSLVSAQAENIDPDNRLIHHFSMRRLDAESIRDSMLMVSGRLVSNLGGQPMNPPRAAEDAAKRLFSGPVDGQGRRSLYTKVTLMEPPRFLALFNQPIPKQTTGRRDVTSVPDQALALLNDPLVRNLANHWAAQCLQDGARHPEERAAQMFTAAFARQPDVIETRRLVQLAAQSAALRGESPNNLMHSKPAWQDVAHAIFNLKEFIHVF